MFQICFWENFHLGYSSILVLCSQYDASIIKTARRCDDSIVSQVRFTLDIIFVIESYGRFGPSMRLYGQAFKLFFKNYTTLVSNGKFISPESYHPNFYSWVEKVVEGDRANVARCGSAPWTGPRRAGMCRAGLSRTRNIKYKIIPGARKRKILWRFKDICPTDVNKRFEPDGAGLNVRPSFGPRVYGLSVGRPTVSM